MSEITNNNSAFAAIADALSDAIEAHEELKSEFEGEAADAFFEAAAEFQEKARPLITKARALAGVSE